ncbi:MAG: hypothetical protein GXP42_13225 [Chloroflexi bacterium]|nr:hypothetical protein [Chloroflexota bacterium]
MLTKKSVIEHEQFIVNEHGERIAAILPIDIYERLLEDIHDLKVIAERKEEPTISLEAVRKRLLEDGFLSD